MENSPKEVRTSAFTGWKLVDSHAPSRPCRSIDIDFCDQKLSKTPHTLIFQHSLLIYYNGRFQTPPPPRGCGGLRCTLPRAYSMTLLHVRITDHEERTNRGLEQGPRTIQAHLHQRPAHRPPRRRKSRLVRGQRVPPHLRYVSLNPNPNPNLKHFTSHHVRFLSSHVPSLFLAILNYKWAQTGLLDIYDKSIAGLLLSILVGAAGTYYVSGDKPTGVTLAVVAVLQGLGARGAMA